MQFKYKVMCFAMAGIFAMPVFAGTNKDTGEVCQGSTCNGGGDGGVVNNVSNSKANAKAVGVGVGVGVGFGGAGGSGGAGGTGGNAASNSSAGASVNAPVNVESKSISIGGTGLSSSANACQGSFSLGPIGKTYNVNFCQWITIAETMMKAGFSVGSIQMAVCKAIDDEIEVAECKGAVKARVDAGLPKEIPGA